jgi:hypothetical protein
VAGKIATAVKMSAASVRGWKRRFIGGE